MTNHGDRPATNVHVTDNDLNDRLDITALTVTPGWCGVRHRGGRRTAAASRTTGSTSRSTRSRSGQFATITVSVTFLAADTPAVVPAGGDPQAVPAPAPPLENLANTACVAADFDSNPDNNCDSLEIPVRDISVVLYTTCVNDAPLLGWTATKSGTLSGRAVQLPVDSRQPAAGHLPGSGVDQ